MSEIKGFPKIGPIDHGAPQSQQAMKLAPPLDAHISRSEAPRTGVDFSYIVHHSGPTSVARAWAEEVKRHPSEAQSHALAVCIVARGGKLV